MSKGVYTRTLEDLAQRRTRMLGNQQAVGNKSKTGQETTVETRDKQREAMIGRHLTVEHIAKISAASRADWDGVTPVLGTIYHKNKIETTQFWTLAIAQEYRCWMCCLSLYERGPICVDHDHATGEVRGIAHISCNLNWKE